jgi:hypothetical protein
MDRSRMRNSPVADVGVDHGTSPHGRAEESQIVGQRALHACLRGLSVPSGQAAHRRGRSKRTNGSVSRSAGVIAFESFTRICLPEPSRSWRGQ